MIVSAAGLLQAVAIGYQFVRMLKGRRVKRQQTRLMFVAHPKANAHVVSEVSIC